MGQMGGKGGFKGYAGAVAITTTSTGKDTMGTSLPQGLSSASTAATPTTIPTTTTTVTKPGACAPLTGRDGVASTCATKSDPKHWSDFGETAARRSFFNVRYWHKADMGCAPHMSAFGGKADMPFCTAHVRL